MRKTPRLSEEALSPYLCTLSSDSGLLSWSELFGNENPVEIEVGFGKGLFLVNATERHPDVNYFGIEIERKYQLYTATRLAKRERSNVRLAAGDARHIFREHIPAESVRVVHVYFPDPWWKKRHHKRRLFTEEFVVECERILLPGGELHLATDVGDYFEMQQELLAGHERLKQLPPPPEKPPEHDMDYLTNYERKARRKGKPVYRGIFQKDGLGSMG